MIRLGDFVIERVSAKGGDEGWTEHWEVKRHRGRVLGWAVSLQGAVRIAVTQGGLDAEAGNRAYTSIEALIARLTDQLTTGLPMPASGGVSGQERGS